MENYFNRQLLTKGRIMLSLLSVFFVAGAYSQTFDSKKTKKILEKTYNKFQNAEAGGYHYKVQFKYFDNDKDTVITEGDVVFCYKDSKQIDFLEHTNRHLKGQFNFSATDIKKDTFLYRFTKENQDQTYKKNTVKTYDDYYSETRVFLSKKGAYFKVDSSAAAYCCGKASVNKNKCFVIEIVYPEETDKILGLTTQDTRMLFINKKTYYPEKMIRKVDMGGLEQYSEITLKDFTAYPAKRYIENDIRDSLALLTTIYTEHVPEVKTQDTITKQNDSLDLNVAPNFRLQQLDGDTIQLSNIDAELIILDFWYVACAPCLASIPFLNELYTRYKGKNIAFYAINTHDDSEKINKIKKLREIKYPILLGADAKIHEDYKVRSFPSLLILDKSLNVLSVHRGFGLGMEEEVFSEIDSLLDN